MDFLENFLERTEFSSYEDFKANYRLKVPEDFNFAFDVMDAIERGEDALSEIRKIVL